VRITDVEPIVLRSGQVDLGRADPIQDAFLVRVHTDEGVVGVGEAASAPYALRTMIEMQSSNSITRGLRELLVGENPLEIGRLWDRMYRGAYYYGRTGAALHAISAIDIALWDILGKATGRPIHELLGGTRVDEVKVYASEVMPDTPDGVRVVAERALAHGHTALKLGWGPLGRDFAIDIKLARAARAALGSEPELMLDGGLAYTVKHAINLLRRLEDLDLYWFEEPLEADDFDGYRRVADAVGVRIAAGEAFTGVRPFRHLVERGHVDVIQPDVGRCGGLSVARNVAALARELGVEVAVHCFSTGILVAASLHFAAILDRPGYSEYSIAESSLASAVVTEPFQIRNGRLRVPKGPGLGELNAALVERLRV
jgi:L-alanine-DL-glutamate epimerase-like enolase superfamily enzyme